jgi:hypothetical protein
MQIGKLLYIVFGTISLVLGIIGIILPLLPTTPFLLVTAACYIRSSKRLYTWLINNRYFGSYIKNYRESKIVPKHLKLKALIVLWITIGSSMIIVNRVIIYILLPLIAAAVSVHILSLKTETSSNNNKKDK